MEKRCTKCDRVKPLDEFHKSSRAKDGRKSACKQCACAQVRAYGAAHREECRARGRQFRRDHLEECREREREYARRNSKRKSIYMRQRYQKNRTKLAIACREYYIKNREARRAYAREHYKRNKDKYIANAARYNKRLKESGDFTPDEWRTLRRKYNNICLHCGSSEPLEPDHVIPLSKNGRNEIENIQPLCHRCNNYKRAKIIDWRGIC